MANGGHPVSGLTPTGHTDCSESVLSVDTLLPISRNSADVLTSSEKTQLPDVPGHICREDPKEDTCSASSVHSASHPSRKTDDTNQRTAEKPNELDPDQILQRSPELCAPLRTSVCPHSITEQCSPVRRHKEPVNMTNNSLQTSEASKQRLQPASLPVQRSHSDSLPVFKQGPPSQPPHADTCGVAFHGGDLDIQANQSRSMLDYKQPLQLLHGNSATASTLAPSAYGDTPTQPHHSDCFHIDDHKYSCSMHGGDQQHKPQCIEAVCSASTSHHSNPENPFSVFCCREPFTANAPPLLSCHTGLEPDGRLQKTAPPYPATNLLPLPRLVSSVSETGLDAKRLLLCCNLSCPWINSFPPGGGLQTLQDNSREKCNTNTIQLIRNGTRDMGTMTSHKDLRDVGVQTSQTSSETDHSHLPPPHVFPRICLVEENGSETAGEQSKDAEEGSGGGQAGSQKSPVKEVKWDAEGMTWEVYGASVDPEELGLAIQRHLELQIKETANLAAKLSRKDANGSQQRSNRGCRWKRSKMIGSIRSPACCIHTTTTAD